MEMWSNQACLGYAIMAMKNKGLDDETIQKVIRSMQSEFDFTGVEEAADVYRKSTD
ncbi:hypothetical protein [Paenibacillus kandeliae]|uniref:hypothetical protein n=1 Tax=Paenibacillus kandeliae TaxID=3231269 RepID=UPI003457CE0D